MTQAPTKHRRSAPLTSEASAVDRRRRIVIAGAATGTALAALGVPRLARGQAAKIRIGYWPRLCGNA